jgi:hypothetical protein
LPKVEISKRIYTKNVKKGTKKALKLKIGKKGLDNFLMASYVYVMLKMCFLDVSTSFRA